MNVDLIKTVLQSYREQSIVSKILKVEKKVASAKGDNYLSEVTRLKLQVLLKSGRECCISLILKELPEGEGRQKMVTESGAFKREVQIYNTVLKEMEHLMRETGEGVDKLWPDLISYRPYNCIVFSDLGVKKFIVPNRVECQDLNHGLLSLVEFARFHALSKALLRNGIIRADEFPPYLLCKDKNFTQKTAGIAIRKMGEILQTGQWGAEWSNYGQKLIESGENAFEQLISVCTSCEEKFKVMNHGDPWTCNMMFKYSTYDERPIAVKFIDYQLTHVNSFAWDVTYYMFTSIEPEIRRQNFDALLKKYAESLKLNMKKLNFSEKDIPTYEEIQNEMKRLSPFRVTAICFFHTIMTSKTEDAFDLDENMKSEGGKPPKTDCYLDPRFKSRVAPDLKDFVKNGII